MAHDSIVETVAQALRVRLLREISDEPLPERWVDLINRLNEIEQAQREAQEQKKDPLPPGRSH